MSGGRVVGAVVARYYGRYTPQGWLERPVADTGSASGGAGMK